MTAYLIGVDEAGYGPNLGPLVIGATAWRVEANDGGRGTGDGGRAQHTRRRPNPAHGSNTLTRVAPAEMDLYQALSPLVTPYWEDDCLPIADSKRLYAPPLGLGRLERGVHSALRLLGHQPRKWNDLVELLGADPENKRRDLPWHDDYECNLPDSATENELTHFSERLEATCDDAQVAPIAVRARMVFPAEFNDLTQHFNTKGAALSHVTLALVRQLVDDLTSKGSARPPPRTTPESRILNPESSFTIVCDKHGARNRYLGLLQHYFADEFIRVAIEGKRESRYHWQWDGMPVEAIFRMQGESFLPTALASMVAKYLRELAQRAVNQFWCARVPDLRPTAGYPNGSRKFKRAIAAKQRELKINDHTLWRAR